MAICKYLAPNGEKSILAASLEQQFGPDATAQMWNWAKTHMELFTNFDENGEPIFEDVVKEYPTVNKSISWGVLQNHPVYSGLGVNVMRTSNREHEDAHFGNPFTGSKVPGLIQMPDIDTAVKAYRDWLKGTAHTDVNPNQRQWILGQIKAGKLDGKSILYMDKKIRGKFYYSHADVLADIVRSRASKAAEAASPKFSKSVVVNLTDIASDKAKGKDRMDKGEVLDRIAAIYQKALAEPGTEFKISLEYTNIRDKYRNGYNSVEMATLFDDAGPVPANVTFTDSFQSVLDSLISRISATYTLEDQEARLPVNYAGEVMLQQMNSLFVPVVDATGRQVGNFTSQEQSEAVDAALATVYAQYAKNPKRTAYQALANLLEGLHRQANRLQSIGDVEGETKYRNVVRSFAFDPEEGKASIADLVLQRLESYGLTIKNRNSVLKALTADVLAKQHGVGTTQEVDLDIEDFSTVMRMVEDESPDQELSGLEGQALRDYNDMVFQLDPRDTASWRMKLLISTLTKPEKSYLGLPVLVNFDDVYQRILGTLADTDRSYDDFKSRLLEASERHPEFKALVERLDTLPVDIGQSTRNEFVKVMSVHYQKYIMTTFKKRTIDKVDTWILNPFDANRASEVGQIITDWKERQKVSPIMKVVAGERVIDTVRMSKFIAPMALFSGNLSVDLVTDLDRLARAEKYLATLGDYRDKDGNLKPSAEKQKTLDLIEKYQQNVAGSQSAIKSAEEITGVAYSEYSKDPESYQKQFVQKLLAEHGIEFTDAMVDDLFKNSARYLKGSKMSLFGSTNNKPDGLFSIFVDRAAGFMGKGSIEEMGDEEVAVAKANNPLHTEQKVVNILARVAANNTAFKTSPSHRTSENKVVFDYVQNTALSLKFREILNSPVNETGENSIHILKNNFVDRYLRRDVAYLAALDGLKEVGSKKGVTRVGMSDREQMLNALAMFQNRGKDLAHYISLTHSDKIMSPVFGNFPKIATGGAAMQEIVTKELFNTFMSEYERIRQHNKESFNHRQYEVGKQLFFILPQFNYEALMEMVKNGDVLNIGMGAPRAITVDDVKELYNVAGDSYEIHQSISVAGTRLVNGLLNKFVNDLTKDTISQWEEMGVIDGVKKKYTFDQAYVKNLIKDKAFLGWTAHKNTQSGREKWEYTDANRMLLNEDDVYKGIVVAAARHFAVNSFLVNSAMSTLVFGDAAQAAKFKDSQIEDGKPKPGEALKIVNATLQEYAKRLAKDIAPGQDLSWDNLLYNSITLADITVSEKYITDAYLKKSYNEIEEASNAQELTTVREHLNVMYAAGKMTTKVYNEMMQIVSDGEKAKATDKHPEGWYEFTEADHIAIIMQPAKPVYVGTRPEERGAQFVDYIKSSSYPLYPPLTANNAIDTLRLKMEAKGDTSKAIARANFLSAQKLGAPMAPVAAFNADGTFKDDMTDADWEASVQVLNRGNFRIQQEVPYDETKEAIKTITQMNKLIVSGISALGEDVEFQVGDRILTGKEILQLKTDIRNELINRNLKDFLEEIGAVNGLVKDKAPLLKRLIEEAKNRGYSANEISTLQYLTEDGELDIPLMFSTGVDKFESLLMSLIKGIVEVKMPGKSYVQASSVGYVTRKQIVTEENLTEAQKNGIVYIDGYDSSTPLRTLQEDGTPAQVLAPFNFLIKNADGTETKAKIEDFLIPGTRKLDMTRVPKELLQLVGARIPNQGHNSMLPIEIVGFVPENMGDLMIVPSAITKQMGADFDVDKLYTYRRAYRYVAGSFIMDTKTNSHIKERLGANVDEYWELKRAANLLMHDSGEERDDKGRYDQKKYNIALGKAVQERYPDGNVPKHRYEVKRSEAGITRDESKINFFRDWEGQQGSDGDLVSIEEDADVKEAIDYYHALAVEKQNRLTDKQLKNQYFDIHWGILTHKDMYRAVLSPLDKSDLADENKLLASANVGFNNWFTTTAQFRNFQSGKYAKQLVGSTSLSVTFNAVIQNKNLKLGHTIPVPGDIVTEPYDIVVHGDNGREIKLSSLSGNGTSTYNNEKRTKQDNLTTLQSAAVDNAKDRTLDNLNLTPDTYKAVAALMMLESDDGEAVNLTYATRMLVQPVIQEFTKLMATGNDSLSEDFQPNLKDKVISQLQMKLLQAYATKHNKSLEDAEGDLNKIETDFEFSPKGLKAELDTNTIEGQLAVLAKFQQLDSVGTRITELQSLFNQDTNGAGAGLLVATDRAMKLENVQKGTIDTGILNESSLYYNTEQGNTFDAAISTAINVVGSMLPYHQLSDVFKMFQKDMGVSQLSADTQKSIVKAARSYVYSSIQVLWPAASTERFRLMYSGKHGESLAHRVLQAKDTWGKSNWFLQRLNPEFGFSVTGPDSVSFNSSKAATYDENLNVTAFMELLKSEDPEQKRLGEDLVRYAYLTGGNQDANSFVNKVPASFLAGTKFSEALRDSIQTYGREITSVSFMAQFFQHNPKKAMQITEAYIGTNLKEIPEVITMDVIGKVGGNPLHRNLQVTEEGVLRYVDFMGIRDKVNGRDLLYMRKGANQYVRIDTLGNKATDEYDGNASIGVKSIFQENRSLSDNLSHRSTDAMQKEAVFAIKAGAEDPGNAFANFGMTESGGGPELATTMLSNIRKDDQVHTALRTVAGILSATNDVQAASEGANRIYGADISLNIKYENDPTRDGAYQDSTGNMRLTKVADRNRAAETFLHEFVHHRIDNIINLTGYSSSINRQLAEKPSLKPLFDSAAMPFRDKHPETMKIMAAMDRIRYEAFTALRTKIVSELGVDAFNAAMLKVQQNEPLTNEHELLIYAVHSMEEFSTHTLTSKPFQEFLNSIPGTDNRTMLEQVWDMFANLLISVAKTLGIDVNKNSLLHEALLLTLKGTTLENTSNVNLVINDAIKSNSTLSLSTEREAVEVSTVLSTTYNKKTVMHNTGISHLVSVATAKRTIDKSIPEEIQRVIIALDKQRIEIYQLAGRIKANTVEGRTKKKDLESKARAIQDTIDELSREHSLELVNKAGLEQMEWVNKVMTKRDPSPQEVILAMSTLSLWSNMMRTVYSETSGVKNYNADLGKLVQDAEFLSTGDFALKAQKVFTGFAHEKGMELSNLDYSKSLKEMFSGTQQFLTLDRAESKLVSTIATIGKEAAEKRDEEISRFATRIDAMQAKMLALVGGNKSLLPDLYKEFMQENDDQTAWGIVQRYSANWYSHIKQLEEVRDMKLDEVASIESPEGRRVAAAAIHAKYWKDLSKVAVVADTRVLFDPTSGEQLDDIIEHDRLIKALGSEKAALELIAEAQENFRKYLLNKESMFAHIEDSLKLSQEDIDSILLTEDELKLSAAEQADIRTTKEAELLEQRIAEQKMKWESHNSPNIFFDAKYSNDKNNGFGSTDYIAYAPKPSRLSFYDTKYANLEKNPAKLEILKEMLAIRDELIENLPDSYTDKMGANFLPAITKDVVNDMMGKLASLRPGALWNKAFIKLSISKSEKDRNDTKRKQDRIPIQYVDSKNIHDLGPKEIEKRHEELANRSTDIPNIFDVFARMALHYKHMSRVIDTVDIGHSILKSIHQARTNDESKGEALTRTLAAVQYWKEALMFKAAKEQEGVSDTAIYSPNVRENHKLVLEVRDLTNRKEELEQKFINGEMLTEAEEAEEKAIDVRLNEIADTGRYLVASKGADVLISFNQMRALAFNPMAAVTNVAFGFISVLIHSNGRIDYTPKTAASALATMRHSFQKWATFGNWADEESQKILHLMERMNIMSEVNDSKYGESNIRSRQQGNLRKAINPLALQMTGDYFTKGMMMIAMMKHKQVQVTEGGVTRNISLWDAHNEFGEWNVEKFGANEKWLSDDIDNQGEWNQFRSKVKKVSTVVFGNQDKNSPLYAKKHMLTRIVGQFRMSWFPEGIATRWQDERFDQALGRQVKGRWKSYGSLEYKNYGMLSGAVVMIRQLLSTLPGVGMDAFNGVTSKGQKVLTEVDKENMRKNLAGLATTMAFLIATLAAKSFVMPSEEEKKRRRKAGQPINSKAGVFLMNMLTRNYQDLMLYSSPGVFDTVTGNIAPCFAVITDASKLIGAVAHLMDDDPKKYKKLWKKTTRMIPGLSNLNKLDFMTSKDVSKIQ